MIYDSPSVGVRGNGIYENRYERRRFASESLLKDVNNEMLADQHPYHFEGRKGEKRTAPCYGVV